MVADLPVGENFQDHASVFINTYFEDPRGVDTLSKAEASSPSSLMKYLLLGKGRN